MSFQLTLQLTKSFLWISPSNSWSRLLCRKRGTGKKWNPNWYVIHPIGCRKTTYCFNFSSSQRTISSVDISHRLDAFHQKEEKTVSEGRSSLYHLTSSTHHPNPSTAWRRTGCTVTTRPASHLLEPCYWKSEVFSFLYSPLLLLEWYFEPICQSLDECAIPVTCLRCQDQGMRSRKFWEWIWWHDCYQPQVKMLLISKSEPRAHCFARQELFRILTAFCLSARFLFCL